jgi:hypothetical protein
MTTPLHILYVEDVDDDAIIVGAIFAGPAMRPWSNGLKRPQP